MTLFYSRSKTWKKGRGARSKSKIGPRRKIYGQNKKKEELKPVSPSHWASDVTIPHGWITVPHDTELRLCQISWPDLPNVSPVVTRSLVVKADFSWVLHVHGHHVDPKKVQLLVDVPPLLDITSTTHLLQCLSNLQTCVGNPDSRYIELAKSKKHSHFLSSKNEIVAYLETGFSLLIDDEHHLSTVRTTSCHLLSTEIRCNKCRKYHRTLLAMAYRREKQNKNPSVQNRKTNYRYIQYARSILVDILVLTVFALGT